MVISICCAALLVDRDGRTVRIGLGSVAPTPVRAPDAESYIAAEIDWDALSAPAESVARFGELVRDAVRPITDHRGTAAYRLVRCRSSPPVRSRGAWRECFGPDRSGGVSDALHDPTTEDSRGGQGYPTRRGAGLPAGDVRLSVNGRDVPVDDAWVGESLLYVLRERLGLPGLEERLRAGRVRVLLGADGRRAGLRLLVLAADAVGRRSRRSRV